MKNFVDGSISKYNTFVNVRASFGTLKLTSQHVTKIRLVVHFLDVRKINHVPILCVNIRYGTFEIVAFSLLRSTLNKNSYVF